MIHKCELNQYVIDFFPKKELHNATVKAYIFHVQIDTLLTD